MSVLVVQADARQIPLPDGCVQTCVTSPPYWGLRDYGHPNQIGLEAHPDLYVQSLVDVFAEVWRVLADDGTLWLNLGDSYAASGYKGSGGIGHGTIGGGKGQSTNKGSFYGRIGARKASDYGLKPKDLVGIPWRTALALQAAGWYLRSDIIWHKPNPMPSSVSDRPTCAHEYLFLLTKSSQYYYDAAAVAEQAVGKTRTTRNRRSVWTITPKPFRGAHFATFPPDLVEPCILAGSRPGDLVLDPFAGSGTVGLVAEQHDRAAVLVERSAEYCQLAVRRLNDTPVDIVVDKQAIHRLPSAGFNQRWKADHAR